MTSTVSSLALAGAIIIPSNGQTNLPTTNSIRASISGAATPVTMTTMAATMATATAPTGTPTILSAAASSSTPTNLSSTPGAGANSSFAFVEERVYKKEKQILLEFDLKTKGKWHLPLHSHLSTNSRGGAKTERVLALSFGLAKNPDCCWFFPFPSHHVPVSTFNPLTTWFQINDTWTSSSSLFVEVVNHSPTRTNKIQISHS